MPNDVNENRKTIEAAAAIDGASSGNVVVRNARHRDAPSTRAASVVRGSICSQNVPTVRTTTATLKNTCASRIGATPRSQPSAPSSPPRCNNAMNAIATTTVGSTNGTSTITRSQRRPGKSQRATTYVHGHATTNVSTVDTAACHSVNQAIRRNDSSRSTSSTGDASNEPVARSPRPMIDTTG